MSNTIKIKLIFLPLFFRPLPNLISHDTADVCLFVKDLDRKSREHENSSEHFKDLLQSKGVKGITQVNYLWQGSKLFKIISIPKFNPLTMPVWKTKAFWYDCPFSAKIIF